MILNNVNLASTGELINLEIRQEKIALIKQEEITSAVQPAINFQNAHIFPGLINSHDHLDFNLFAQLGDRIYENYVDWGKHIHTTCAAEIEAVLNVPEPIRSQWGVYKNLLCGVTTVLNHGQPATVDSAPIKVFNNCQNLHSVQLEKNWKFKLNNPLKARLPVVIHTGEGTDIASFVEINRLNRWNLLKRDIIAVHGVAMKESQAEHFKALVWCPQSNFFLLNKTAHIDVLKAHIPILFGTDSTLSSHWDIWDHIRLARQTGLLNDEELYNTLTLNPAKTWGLNSGSIAEGKQADLVVARKKPGMGSQECFFNTQPHDILLVMQQGSLRLIDGEILEQLKCQDVLLSNFTRISINGAVKYVEGDLTKLAETIRQYYPKADLPFTVVKHYR